ncbi:TPA: XRE family transcriptional regulator [Bacillus thuringiensis]|uniref:Transcriptional regulator n=1 Tax=Bacillus thuringiensis serovar iberica TaxID=180866 RepID=A0A9X6LFC5_BACTU|nr:AimR family lysis-lysogeny pheromone receptor [Bacillus thuringiensis]MEB9625235.1 AimR family lysis-lysogeny pheromone receptor [Bacillus cereus]OUB44875.1 hypothetical protein BK741_21635 [Bacillus thuringiensis serovar iberica]HDR5354294.1 XRE family transcriptional regulator [Bacillus thuringiensis]
MNELRNQIDNMIFSKMKNYKDLSKETGVPESTISKWLTHGTEISAFSFIKIISALLPDDKHEQEELIILYLKTLKDGSCLNRKVVFIISYLNRNMKVFNYLLTTCINHKYSSMKKFSRVFQLYNLRLLGGNIKEIYQKIPSFYKNATKKEKDLEVLCDILSMIIKLDLGEMKLIEGYRKKITKHFCSMRNNDLKIIYRFWVDELFSYYLLRKNELEKFRRYYNVLRHHPNLIFFPVIQSSLDLKAGESYLNSNEYEKAVMLLENALQVFRKWGDHSRYTQALNDIHFLRIKEWKDIDKIDFENLHLAEKALYHIQLEEYSQAIKILYELKEKNGKLTPLQTCYLGMAKFDLNLIRESIGMLRENNDYLFLEFAEQMYDKYSRTLEIML